MSNPAILIKLYQAARLALLQGDLRTLSELRKLALDEAILQPASLQDLLYSLARAIDSHEELQRELLRHEHSTLAYLHALASSPHLPQPENRSPAPGRSDPFR